MTTYLDLVDRILHIPTYLIKLLIRERCLNPCKTISLIIDIDITIIFYFIFDTKPFIVFIKTPSDFFTILQRNIELPEVHFLRHYFIS